MGRAVKETERARRAVREWHAESMGAGRH
jgi:hypothetical protein